MDASRKCILLLGTSESETLSSNAIQKIEKAKNAMNDKYTVKQWKLKSYQINEEAFGESKLPPAIEEMILTQSGICKVDFVRSDNLLRLRLRQNKIKEFAVKKDTYPFLQLLDISENIIETLDLRLVDLPRLTTLLVEQNQITQIITKGTPNQDPPCLETLSLSMQSLKFRMQPPKQSPNYCK